LSDIDCCGNVPSGLTGSAIATTGANIGWSNSGQSTYYNASTLVNNINN
jgi:hypothetical protein